MSMRLGVTERSNGSDWIKTSRGWVLQPLGDTGVIPTCERIENRSELSISNRGQWLCFFRSELSINNREVSHGRNIKVVGTKGQRRVSVCVSDLIQQLDLLSATTDLRKQTYLYDLMCILMKDHLTKVSGTTHRQLFKILETMVDIALVNELHIPRMKVLLVDILKCLVDTSTYRRGCKSVWNRHIITVTNLCTKMENFRFTKRNDDDLPYLTDLPKECIRDIMLRLDSHKDIINLGMTCSDLYYQVQDSSIWEKLCQSHFTEKQMMTFIDDTDSTSEYTMWQALYLKCFKKFGVKKSYTDKLVICSACKTLHWMMVGHFCWKSSDNEEHIFLDPVLPAELINMVPL